MIYELVTMYQGNDDLDGAAGDGQGGLVCWRGEADSADDAVKKFLAALNMEARTLEQEDAEYDVPERSLGCFPAPL